MSIVPLAADSERVIAATDRRTIMETAQGPTVERDDQTKCTTIFDTLGVATAGMDTSSTLIGSTQWRDGRTGSRSINLLRTDPRRVQTPSSCR